MTQGNFCLAVLICVIISSPIVSCQKRFEGFGKCTDDTQCRRHQFCLTGVGTCELCSALGPADIPLKCQLDEEQTTVVYGGCVDDEECDYGQWCFERKCQSCEQLLDTPAVYKERCSRYSKQTPAKESTTHLTSTREVDSNSNKVSMDHIAGVSDIPTTTTTMTTTPNKNAGKGSNVSIIIVYVLIGVILTVLGIYICTKRICRKKKGIDNCKVVYNRIPKVLVVTSDGKETTTKVASEPEESLPDGIQETREEKEKSDDPIVVQVEEEEEEKEVKKTETLVS